MGTDNLLPTYAEFVAVSSNVAMRGEWWVEMYLKNPLGVEEIVRVSRRGTPTETSIITIGTDTIPANINFDKRLITAPTVAQSLWQQGRILSNSLPSYGGLKLINADGGFDQYRPENGYIWSGCRCKIYHLDYLYPSTAITKVFDGTLADPHYNLSVIDIPLKGREALFDVPTSERKYRGTSYQLELSGDCTVTYGGGTPAALITTGSMTLERWIWLEALPSVARKFWGWFGGTTWPWVVYLLTTGKLRFSATIAGVEQIVDSTVTLSAFKPYHFSYVISGTTLTLYLWDEDAQTETVETTLNAFTSATRQGNTGCTYVDRSGSDATFKPWFDESRVWNIARTHESIIADRHRPLAGNVPVTCVHAVGYDDGTGTTVTDSSATGANGAITGAGTSTWLWACEGGPELAGTPKPDSVGAFRCMPILVDPIRYIYQVGAGGSVQDIDSQEGGLGHTMDADTSTLRAFIVTAPTNNASTHFARGLVRIKNQPLLPITCAVQGYNGGALGYVGTPERLTRYMVTQRGPKLADPSGLDTTSFTAFFNASDAATGMYLPAPIKLKDALDFIVRTGAGWWGYVGASTLFHVERFAGPAVTSDFSYDQTDIVKDSLNELAPQAIVYKVVIKYRRLQTPLTEDQVAASVKGTANWQQWTQEWLEYSLADDAIRDAYPGDASIPVTFETGLYYEQDAVELATYLLGILKGRKGGWAYKLRMLGQEAAIGDTVDLSMTLQGDRERLDLDGVKKYVVLTKSLTRQKSEISHDVWG